MQCILVLIADALAGLCRTVEIRLNTHKSPPTPNTDHDERIPLFLRTSESDPELPYTPLLRQVADFYANHL